MANLAYISKVPDFVLFEQVAEASQWRHTNLSNAAGNGYFAMHSIILSLHFTQLKLPTDSELTLQTLLRTLDMDHVASAKFPLFF